MSLDPTQVPAVDPDELATAFNLVMNSAAGRVALEHSLDDLQAAVDPDKRWLLRDRPLTRGFAALRERYPQGGRFQELALRIAAVAFVARRPELQPWLRPLPGQDEYQRLHPAVLDAAAAEPLTTDFEFFLPSFLIRIEQIALDRYPGLV